MDIQFFPLFTKTTLSGLALTLGLSGCTPPQSSSAPTTNNAAPDLLNFETTADWETPPDIAPQPLGEGVCSMGFEATVRSGPSAGNQLAGLLKFKADDTGPLQEATFYPNQGQPIAVEGNLSNTGEINLKFTLPDKGVMSGTGKIENNRKLCAGTLIGPLTGPMPGDSGDWLGDAEATTTVTDQPNLMVYAVTATNQVYSLNTVTKTITLIAGIAESSTDTLLEGPTSVIYMKPRTDNNLPTSAERDNTHGLWIADTGNQRLVNYRFDSTSNTWQKTSQEVNLATIQAVTPEATVFRPRSLVELNQPGIIPLRMLMFADQANHVIQRYSGTALATPRLERFSGRFGYPLSSALDSFRTHSANPLEASVFRTYRLNQMTSLSQIVPFTFMAGNGYHESPISIQPKRIIQGVTQPSSSGLNGLTTTMQVISQNGCSQNLYTSSRVRGIANYNYAARDFVSVATYSFERNISGFGDFEPQPANCETFDGIFNSRATSTGSPSPGPTTTPSPVPSATPTPSPTPTPTPTPTATPKPSERPQDSLTVTPDKVSMTVGDMVTLTATAMSKDGSTLTNILWKNSDDAILKLETKGPLAFLTAQKEGKAEISVSSENGLFQIVTIIIEPSTTKK